MKNIREKKQKVIPLNPIRKILEQYCSHHISDEAVRKLRDSLEDIAHNISAHAEKEFKRLNECREKQGLRRLKRLNEWAVFLTIKNIIKGQKDIDTGLQPEEIVNPGGKMHVHATAEPDKTTNDQREVV